MLVLSLKRAFWLAAPFVVLALLVSGVAGMAMWVRQHPATRETVAAPLASSVSAVDALASIASDQQDAAGNSENARAARRRITIAAWRYAAVRPEGGAALRKAVDGLLDAAVDNAGAASIRDASRQLAVQVKWQLASERQQLAHAAERVESARIGLLQRLGELGLLWSALGIAGGLFAASIVRRRLAAIREARREEEARTAELEQFAGRVAHDLVSPLGPVTAGVHVLSQRLRGDARAQAAARTVRASVDKVAATVEELLRFAWSGGRAAPGEKADLARVVDSLRDELLPAARETGVALVIDPPPRVQIACSETAVALVLQNLVRNAIKVVAGAPRKFVRASAMVLSGKVRLMVEDSGPGVPQGMEKAIFEPYVRGAEDGEGIGLGLATVKRLVESRSGRVGVTSSPRLGAMFWVELPLARS